MLIRKSMAFWECRRDLGPVYLLRTRFAKGEDVPGGKRGRGGSSLICLRGEEQLQRGQSMATALPEVGPAPAMRRTADGERALACLLLSRHLICSGKRHHDRLHRRLGPHPFGKLDAETVESLIVRVANEALDHAGIGPEDVDEIVLGHFNAGFSPQDFTASLVLQADPRLRFKPATRVENACATGSAAVHQAVKRIEARKRARVVLVVGVEQMTKTPGPEIGKNLLKASYLPEDGDTPGGFAGVFGKIAATISSGTATSPTRSP
jgi:hypothetical protein